MQVLQKVCVVRTALQSWQRHPKELPPTTLGAPAMIIELQKNNYKLVVRYTKKVSERKHILPITKTKLRTFFTHEKKSM